MTVLSDGHRILDRSIKKHIREIQPLDKTWEPWASLRVDEVLLDDDSKAFIVVVIFADHTGIAWRMPDEEKAKLFAGSVARGLYNEIAFEGRLSDWPEDILPPTFNIAPWFEAAAPDEWARLLTTRR